MGFATPPTLTGNPGQSRDLQFSEPFLSPGFVAGQDSSHHCTGQG
jgi:hypothetical protein